MQARLVKEDISVQTGSYTTHHGGRVVQRQRSCPSWLIAIACLLLSSQARADWHLGTVEHVYLGYDGTSLVFSVSGWNRSNCTCYSTWPTYMCLGRNRVSFKDEYALLLAAKAQGTLIDVQIDEASCSVLAIGVR